MPFLPELYAIPESLPREIFRSYDIRGQVPDALNADIVYALGLVFASEALLQQQRQIIVARDGRHSSPVLAKALITGILASGCDVIDIGLVPTPVLYYATQVLTSATGVMLTASHNPSDYNGLKMVLAGHALSGEEILALADRIDKKQWHVGAWGHYQEQDLRASYFNRITQSIRLGRRMKIVLDCGNGVPGILAGDVFKQLGCEVIELYCEVDGRFPNHAPDTSQAENLQDLIGAVKQHEAELGIALDGDGDRLAVVTAEGEIIWPDRLMILYAQDLLRRVPGAEIIYDVKCSWNLPLAIMASGGRPLMWKTGHSLIKSKLKNSDALLAGEMSGHIFFKERWYGFDDGIYAAARLLEILSDLPQTPSAIFASLPDSISTPELRIKITEAEKMIFMQEFIRIAQFPGALISTLDGLRVDYAEGWGLLRPSNTSPYLILRFEAKTEEFLQLLQEQFRRYIQQIDHRLLLPF